MGVLGKIIESLGALGESVISGVLTGLAKGLEAFAKPQIALGAVILGASITAIGAGIAGAAWIMGKLLPTLAEGLQGFADIDGDNLVRVGKGVAALGAGLAVFGVGGALGSVGNVIGSLVDGFGKLFGGKSQVEKLKEFASVGPGLEQTGTGLIKFNQGISLLVKTDIDKIDKLSDALTRLNKANDKGFGQRTMDKLFGESPKPVVVQQLANTPAAEDSYYKNLKPVGSETEEQKNLRLKNRDQGISASRYETLKLLREEQQKKEEKQQAIINEQQSSGTNNVVPDNQIIEAKRLALLKDQMSKSMGNGPANGLQSYSDAPGEFKPVANVVPQGFGPNGESAYGRYSKEQLKALQNRIAAGQPSAYAGATTSLSTLDDSGPGNAITPAADTAQPEKIEQKNKFNRQNTEQKDAWDKMLDQMNILNKSMLDVVDYNRSIADHTERTARGVQ